MRRDIKAMTGATGTAPLEPLHLMPVIKLYLAGEIVSTGEITTIVKQTIPKRKNKDNRQKRKCDIFNVFAND
jgi:hypothetical protein